MALMYGGWVKFPLGAYTQAEREALEPIADAPVNFAIMNQQFQKRYGIQLRALSTGSISDAVTRKGIGLLLAGKTGIGAINQPGTFTHAAFYVPLGSGTCLLYEPLAPNMSEPTIVTNTRVVAWAKGAGVDNAREVRQWEFGPPPAGVDMVIRPVREDFMTKTGNATPGGQFYLEGPGAGTPKYFHTATAVSSVAESVDGTYRLVFYYNGGATGGEYLWMPRANLNPVAGTRDPATAYAKNAPVYTPPPAPAPDCTEAVRLATAPLNDKIAKLKAAAQAHADNQTNPEDTFAKAMQEM
jgi:hypothetical protein